MLLLGLHGGQSSSSPLTVKDGGEIVSWPGHHLNTDTAQVSVARGTPATSTSSTSTSSTTSSTSSTTLSRVSSLAGDWGTQATEKATLDPAVTRAWKYFWK